MMNYLRKTLAGLAVAGSLAGCASRDALKPSLPAPVVRGAPYCTDCVAPPAPAPLSKDEARRVVDATKSGPTNPSIALARFTASYNTNNQGTQSALVIVNDLPLGISVHLYGEKVGAEGFADAGVPFVSVSGFRHFETPFGKVGPMINYAEDIGQKGTTSFGVSYKAPVDFLLEGRFMVRDNDKRDRAQLILNRDLSDLLGLDKGRLYGEVVGTYDFTGHGLSDRWEVDAHVGYRISGPLQLIVGGTFEKDQDPVGRIGLQLEFPFK